MIIATLIANHFALILVLGYLTCPCRTTDARVRPAQRSFSRSLPFAYTPSSATLHCVLPCGMPSGAHPFTIDAWVLLPDHLHCIRTRPLNEADFGSRWSLIKRHTVRSCGDLYHRPEWMNSTRLQRRESTLWQRRFREHQIRDDADYLRHMDYLHMNPVKHGHCTRPDAWPYSSLH